MLKMDRGKIQTNRPENKKIDDDAQERDAFDRLYVSRKEGGRRLTRIEDSMDASMRGHENYI